MNTLRNKISIIGKVITEPVVRTSTPFEGRFLIQTKQYIRPANKKSIPVNHQIIVYGKLAARAIDTIEKDMVVLIEARFSTVLFEKVPKTIIEAQEILILPSKKKKKCD